MPVSSEPQRPNWKITGEEEMLFLVQVKIYRVAPYHAKAVCHSTTRRAALPRRTSAFSKVNIFKEKFRWERAV